jgi:hypothetical protein
MTWARFFQHLKQIAEILRVQRDNGKADRAFLLTPAQTLPWNIDPVVTDVLDHGPHADGSVGDPVPDPTVVLHPPLA